MKAKVTRAYIDRITGAMCLKGDEVELTDERAAELSAGGFVEVERTAPDLDGMTVKQLKELIAAKGGEFPDRVKKAELVEIAKGL